MKKKIILTFLAFLLAFGAIGCENVEYIENSADSSSENVYDKIEQEVPTLDPDENGELRTQKFIIATDKKNVFWQDEENPGSVSKAIEKRNDFLFDKYGAEIQVLEMTYTNLSNAIIKSLQSDLDPFDMIAVSAKETVKLYVAGLLGDMNTLPEFNIENAYFDANNAKSVATNSTLYLLPDPTAQYYEELYTMFFNRDIVEKTAGKDPESLVMQGLWTWDSFNEIARASAPGVYAGSTADLTTDTFAFGAYYSENTLPLVMWTSTSNKMIDNSYKNPVKLSMSADQVKGIASALQKTYNSRGRFPLEGEEAANAFLDGRLAFLVHKFGYFYKLRDGAKAGENYGFLPIPKASETQTSYNSLASSDARVLSIPKTVENDDDARKKFVSAVISATCAAGRETVKNAFVNEHIALYLYDNEETVMLQTICESATFDFATVYGSVIGEIRRPTTTAISDYIEFGSALNTSIGSALSAFNKYSQEKFK